MEFSSRIRRDPLVVTQSDLALFKSCRRQWYLGTYLGLSERHPKAFGPLTLGTRVHKALDMYYGDGRDLVASYEWLADNERRQLDDSGVVYGRQDWESETELGRIMLEGYLEWLAETGEDSDLEIISTEEKLTAKLMGGKVELRGKVDLKVRRKSDGSRLIFDHKTTAHFSNVTTIAPYTPQLPTYMVLERINNPDSEDSWLNGASFNMLRKVKRSINSKPPFYSRFDVRHNDTSLRNFWTKLNGVVEDYVRVVDQLDSGVDHQFVAYPTAGSPCRYCPFRFPCLGMDDGSRVEDMLNDLFVQRDPHERYDEDVAELIPDSATR